MSRLDTYAKGFFKASIISSIQLLASNIYGLEKADQQYSYNVLSMCTYENLEQVRDRLLNEYNEIKKK